MPYNKNHATILLLIGTIATVAGGVAISMLWLLYQSAFQDYSDRLKETTRTQAEIVNSLVSYNKKLYIDNDDAFASTMEILREANNCFDGIGKTGEFTVASWVDEEITYYISQRVHGTPARDQSLFRSNLSQPMRAALSGQSGVMIAEDYRGITVLAAYEPVKYFNLGVVAKIEISEIRAPFINAGIFSLLAGIVLLIAGSMFYLRLYERLINKEGMLQNRYGGILDNALDGVITIDTNGIIQTVNSAAAELFRYNKDEMEGNSVNMLMANSLKDLHDSYLANSSNGNNKSIVGSVREIEGIRKDGTAFPMDLSLNKMEHDHKVYFTGVVRDISERQRILKAMEDYREHLEDQVEKRTAALSNANKKLEKLANIDGLTGIANRRVFDNVIKRECSRAIRQATPISLILCDVDFFKNFNDTYGHIAGDETLCKVATTIHDIFQRAGDVVARYGGEEFAIILPGVDFDGLSSVADQVRSAVWALNINHLCPDGTDRVSISVGGASAIPTQDFAVTTLIKYADESLYKAKQNGRNRFVTIDINTEL